MSRAALVLLASAVAVALPSAAQADTVVTMAGEQTNGDVSDPNTTSVTCDETSSGTIHYRAVGPATGPYPGTFEENGTITVSNGVVVGFAATFTIESALATIQGTKTERPLGSGGISCGAADAPDFPIVEFAGGTFVALYRATITSPLGSFEDHGTSGVGLDIHELASGVVRGAVSATFVSNRESSELTLSPPQAVNAAGTTHTVTAILLNPISIPLPGERILFTVAGSVTTTGFCITDVQGMCSFTYQGPEVPGADLITGCYDFDHSGAFDPGEKCAEATSTWVSPIVAPGGATGGGYVGIAGEQAAFGFSAQPAGAIFQGSCNVVDLATDTHVRCLDVTSMLVLGNHATFFGQAEVNGVVTNYRIDVDDLDETGAFDTFLIQTDLGYTVGGEVTNGNVRVSAG